MNGSPRLAQLSRSSPPAPHAVLRDRALVQMGLTQAQLASALGVSRPHLNMILNGRCGITAEFALRLGHVLGTGTQYWLQLRSAFELHLELVRLGGELDRLPKLVSAQGTEAPLSIAA